MRVHFRREIAIQMLFEHLPASSLSSWLGLEVCQGRMASRHYNSNPDLCHWMLHQLGCSNNNILCRSTDVKELPLNTNQHQKLLHGAQRMSAWKPYIIGKEPLPGDILFLGDESKDEMVRISIFIDKSEYGWRIAASGIHDKLGGQSAEIFEAQRHGDTIMWFGNKISVYGWIDLDCVEF